MGHVIDGVGLGCLDNDSEISEIKLYDKAKRLRSSMEIAELFHTVACVINIPNSSSNAVKVDGQSSQAGYFPAPNGTGRSCKISARECTS